MSESTTNLANEGLVECKICTKQNKGGKRVFHEGPACQEGMVELPPGDPMTVHDFLAWKGRIEEWFGLEVQVQPSNFAIYTGKNSGFFTDQVEGLHGFLNGLLVGLDYERHDGGFRKRDEKKEKEE